MLSLEQVERPVELVELLVHVHRHADRARLVRQRPHDGLSNPPSGVGRELEAPSVVELLDRPGQADVALLDQVQQVQAPVYELLGHRHHQPQVGLDQGVLGCLDLALGPLQPSQLAPPLGGPYRQPLLSNRPLAIQPLDLPREEGRVRPPHVRVQRQPADRAREGYQLPVIRPAQRAVFRDVQRSGLVPGGLALRQILQHAHDPAQALLESAHTGLHGLGVRSAGAGNQLPAQLGVLTQALLQFAQLAPQPRTLRENRPHAGLGGLQLLGEAHFALAVQQRHHADLGQVQADVVLRRRSLFPLVAIGGQVLLDHAVVQFAVLRGARIGLCARRSVAQPSA